jgi:hypothetical protein
MGLETKVPLHHEVLATPSGCIVRWKQSRPRFQVVSLVGWAFLAALFYAPLVAAAVFLVGQVVQAPWYLVLLASLFVVQVGSVGPVPMILSVLYRELLDLGWNVLFACFGHHDLEVTREWLYFGDHVGPFNNLLNRGRYRRVSTRAIQQIIVFAYTGQTTPEDEGIGRAEPSPPTGDGSIPWWSFVAKRLEESVRDLVNGLTAEGNGELAIIEHPGAQPTPYFTGFQTGILLNLAEHLHRHIFESQPSAPSVAVIDKPAVAVRAEWETKVRQAGKVFQDPLAAMWWQRTLWLRAVLLLNSLVGLVALQRLIWVGAGVNVWWKVVAVGCILVELFVVVALMEKKDVVLVDRPRLTGRNSSWLLPSWRKKGVQDKHGR